MTAIPAGEPYAASTPPFRRDLLGWFGLVSFVLLTAGGWLTSLGLGDWYDSLELPPFQPPAWVFTPAWTAILALLAIAAWRVARTTHPSRWVAMSLYGGQCVLNAGWSLLFFTVARPDVALAEILVLDATLLAMMVAFAKVDRPAAWLLTPYLAWLLFSTAINWWVVAYNPPA